MKKLVMLVMLALAALVVTLVLAQDKGKDHKAKSYTFHGKVEAVTGKGLTVNGEKVEGWMDAMTMTYAVDKPEVLKSVKAGDRISATVFEGDLTLHNVQVAPPGEPAKNK